MPGSPATRRRLLSPELGPGHVVVPPPGPPVRVGVFGVVAHAQGIVIPAGLGLDRPRRALERLGADSDGGVCDRDAVLPHHRDIHAPRPRCGRGGLCPDGYNEGSCGGTIQLHDASMPGHGLMRSDIRTQQ